MHCIYKFNLHPTYHKVYTIQYPFCVHISAHSSRSNETYEKKCSTTKKGDSKKEDDNASHNMQTMCTLDGFFAVFLL